jgi:hypothetical protein
MSRVSWKPMNAQSRTMKNVTPVLTQMARLLAKSCGLGLLRAVFRVEAEIVGDACQRRVVVRHDGVRCKQVQGVAGLGGCQTETPARLLAP